MTQTCYNISIEILLTVNQPETRVIKDRIKEEINTLCHRLECLEGLSNNVYLHGSRLEVLD